MYEECVFMVYMLCSDSGCVSFRNRKRACVSGEKVETRMETRMCFQVNTIDDQETRMYEECVFLCLWIFGFSVAFHCLKETFASGQVRLQALCAAWLP